MQKFRERDVLLPAALAEMDKQKNDVTYWMYSARMGESKNVIEKFIWKIKRKFL